MKEGGTGQHKTIREFEPTRRQSTCEKDHARAEIEREQSKRDRATKRRRKQSDIVPEKSKAKEKRV